MAALTTRAEQALRHDAAATETTSLLRQRQQLVVARCAGPRSALAALATATAAAEDLARRHGDAAAHGTRMRRGLHAAGRAASDGGDARTRGQCRGCLSRDRGRRGPSGRELAGGVRVRAANAGASCARRLGYGGSCAPASATWTKRSAGGAYCFDVDVVADP